MDEKPSFDQRYQEGHTPWDHDEADFNLVQTVESFPIHPCKTLELGCGTGSNAVWLAQSGFDVAAMDLSKTAIERAMQRAETARLDIDFSVRDLLADPWPQGPFDFIFDRGCLHSLGENKKECAKRAAEHLVDGGLWLSLMGNADAPPRDVGPPRMTARDIAKCVEDGFEILSLTAGHFGGEQDDPPKAWICLMKKRSNHG